MGGGELPRAGEASEGVGGRRRQVAAGKQAGKQAGKTFPAPGAPTVTTATGAGAKVAVAKVMSSRSEQIRPKSRKAGGAAANSSLGRGGEGERSGQSR